MKKINKNIKFLLALSLFLSTGTPVLARTEIQHEEGREPLGNIEVRSNIGAFDPGNPDQPAPIDPENPAYPFPDHPSWLWVSVPDVIMFYSTGEDNDTITSPAHRITNHSARGLGVYVHDFTLSRGSVDPINALSLVPQLSDDSVLDGEEIVLMNDKGFVVDPAPERLMTIDRTESLIGTQDAYFTFAGEVTPNASAVSPVFNLVLRFSVDSLGLDDAPFE